MRSFDGQRSDGAPIRRNRQEKEKQLQELEQKRAHLGMHTSSTLRAAMDRKIAELKTELALADRAAAAQSAAGPAPRRPGGPRR
ncbi:hypothetical protein AB4093_10940 [Inquilinus sp. 2KB_12]|jgi:hypothetical protein|uniref:Biopolymer transport protein ExbB/TolQ n=1 Tax=Inquilinus ginsengisoli TaxID=363840 RepID=A0ABU1JX75_9PROT|nr:hypothetical protein [Inquilinus ginsengisoli]MDR6292898.1 biopolymer transport protein ExbB/TolQ [Inquilinus ginsengisoli]HMG49068.1 hypothetical protein [Inquilinus sp.]